MIFITPDFPNGFNAEALRAALVAAHGDAFGLCTDQTQVLVGSQDPAVRATCLAHFAIDWNAANATAKQKADSIDQANAGDAMLVALRAMSNAELDAWWAANVTNAAQAIQVLKRLAKLVIRRL